MIGRRVFGLLAVLFLSAALMTGGCGREQEAAQVSYGVADLETLVKAHPLYPRYFRLQSEYESLAAQYRVQQKQLLHLSETQEKMRAVILSENGRKAAEEEYKARVKIKEDSLNAQLRNLYNEITLRHKAEGGRAVLCGGAADANTEIANLQMKLRILGVSGEEKQKASAELKDLLNGRHAEIDQTGWTADEKKEMDDKRTAAQSELKAYAEQVAEEIRQRQAAAQNTLASPKLPDPETWNGEWRKRMQTKQKEMADVKAQIMDDIRDRAAEIGRKKNLAMIFSSYRTNISAVDVTGEIADELVQLKINEEEKN